MAKPKRVASKPAASGRVAAGAPAPVTFSSPKPEAPAKEDSYQPEKLEYGDTEQLEYPDRISTNGSYHGKLFDIANEISNRIDIIKQGKSTDNKPSATVAKKAAPAEMSLRKAMGHIGNSIQAHKAGDAWTSTSDMRDAAHHITNAVNYLNSSEGWGGDSRGTNPANFWAANSRKTSTTSPSLTNVHADIQSALNGYLTHVQQSNWPKKSHIMNKGTDFTGESITPNSEFEGYGQAPGRRRIKPVDTEQTPELKHYRTQVYPHWQRETDANGRLVNSQDEFVGSAAHKNPRKWAADRDIKLPVYTPPVKTTGKAVQRSAAIALEPVIMRREYGNQVRSHWEAQNPGKTFIGSDAHRDPSTYAKVHGIDLKYPSRALFEATGDPFHLIAPKVAEEGGENLTEEQLNAFAKRQGNVVKKATKQKPVDDASYTTDAAQQANTGYEEAPEVKRGSRKAGPADLPHIPEVSTKLKGGDIQGAARALWEAHYDKAAPLSANASMDHVKNWQRSQDRRFFKHPAGENSSAFLDAHGYRVPGAGTRSIEFSAGQGK